MLSSSLVSDSVGPYGLQLVKLLCSFGFSRQEYWNGLLCPSPGDLPDSGIDPGSSALQIDSLLSEPPGKCKVTSNSRHDRMTGTRQALSFRLL